MFLFVLNFHNFCCVYSTVVKSLKRNANKYSLRKTRKKSTYIHVAFIIFYVGIMKNELPSIVIAAVEMLNVRKQLQRIKAKKKHNLRKEIIKKMEYTSIRLPKVCYCFE